VRAQRLCHRRANNLCVMPQLQKRVRCLALASVCYGKDDARIAEFECRVAEVRPGGHVTGTDVS
jgi:hypothetical protein